jgi:cytochrome c2
VFGLFIVTFYRTPNLRMACLVWLRRWLSSEHPVGIIMYTVALKLRKPTIGQLVARLILTSLMVAGCGAPAVVSVRNIANATAAPPTAIITPQAGMDDNMPGMAMTAPTASPTAPSAVTPVTEAAKPASSSTDYVLIWIMFGTPTPTPSSKHTAVQATAVPGTPISVAATPSHVNTLPSTATRRVPTTDAGSQNAGNRSPGDPAQGKLIFSTVAGCVACHDVSTGATLVGPSLKGVESRAASRKPGMSASDYLRESILIPNAYVVPGFQPGIMLQTFGQVLTAQQLNDVIAYLLTLS